MNEVFVEQIIKRKTSIKGMCLRMLAILLVFAGLFSMLFLGVLGFTITALLVYGAYLIFNQTSVEYEYSLVNGDLTVDKIMGQNKRKHAGEFDIKQAEIIAPAYSDDIISRINGIKTLDFSSGFRNDGRYSMILYDGKERIQVLFDPNENIIDAMYTVRPSIVKKA